jgi:putative ABC transport system ATP-binding protein
VHIRDGRLAAESGPAGDGKARIVVGRGGWLHLPEDYLVRAGIGTRAVAAVEEGRIVVSPAEGERLAPVEALPETPPPEMPSELIAETVALSKSYGRATVLTDVGARFTSARLTAVTGPSGSGKTTLLHLVAGLGDPSSGEIRILGRRLGDLDRTERARLRRDAIALVGQQAGLLPFLSAEENVELALAVRDVDPDEAHERALEALDAVGLAARAGQRVSRLSMGEQARVALARAVAARPALLLVDEPTSRLDEANAVEIALLLGRLAHERGIAVVCATHDARVIEQADEELPLAVASSLAA